MLGSEKKEGSVIHPILMRLAAASCLALLATGCMHMPGGIAPSNIPMEGRSYRVVGDTGATDSSVWLLGLIPVSGSNTTDRALRAAMHKRDADALINITVEAYTQWWILVVRHVTEVRGTAVKFE